MEFRNDGQMIMMNKTNKRRHCEECSDEAIQL
jgi:hypothetical protein